MKLEVDTSSPGIAKVSLRVPSDEFQKEVKEGLQHVSRGVRMKGFRPGKIPVQMLEKQYGESIRAEVKERFVQRAYGQAVEENELKPIAHPRLGPDALELASDGSFDVEFEVPLKPTFELPDYKGLSATSELEPVMDEQLDATLEELRRGQSTPTEAGDEGVDEDGFVVANLTFEANGETVFEREGIRLGVLSPPPGVDADLFKEGLVGTKDGEDLEFPMEIPEFVENEDVRGEKGTAKLHVTSAMRLVPPTDDELLGMFGDDVSNMDELRTFLQARLEENAQERENQRIESALLDEVLEKTDVDLPAPMLEQQTEARLEQLTQQMEQQGATEEQLEEARTSGRADAEADARKGLKALLVVERIGEAESLLVSSEDMDEELARIAERNQTDIEEVRKYYGQNNLGQQLAIEILEKKVRRFLRENAEVKDPA
ncbi:MAG: trigger factor [Planctomycetota bacterium]